MADTEKDPEEFATTGDEQEEGTESETMELAKGPEPLPPFEGWMPAPQLVWCRVRADEDGKVVEVKLASDYDVVRTHQYDESHPVVLVNREMPEHLQQPEDPKRG